MDMDNNMYENKRKKLAEYDYSSLGYYFITICSKNKNDYFCKNISGKIVLSEIGLIVKKTWLNIPNFYKNVDIDEFIIMPDHIHGIIIINKSPMPVSIPVPVGVEHCSTPTGTGMDGNGNQNYGLLSKIIKSFKNEVTKIVRKKYDETIILWQRSFYDRIIRDETELYNARNYIKYKPEKIINGQI